ncbi:MAG: protein kinase, partial [Myxococcota bacterium]
MAEPVVDPFPAKAMSSEAFLRALAEAPPVGRVDRSGERLGHFALQGCLGRGGMGEVYAALDQKLGRRVAVKLLRPDVMSDPQRRRRFMQEARAAAAITHRHIVTVHEIGMCGEDVFIAMELVEGETLRAHLAARAPLSVEASRALMRMVA